MSEVWRPVSVLFHPDHNALTHLCSMAQSGLQPILIVNGIKDRNHLAPLQAAGATIIENEANEGIAQAFNQGIQLALKEGARYVLLLDQDTQCSPTMGDDLVNVADEFISAGGQLACVGPTPVDVKRPDASVVGNIESKQPVEISTIISSGMLIPSDAIEEIGGMWNELFIDHVDHEWCFRARKFGRKVLIAPQISMPHNLGDTSFAIRGQFKAIHRSPMRHFHIVRNTLWLAQCSFISRRWRLIELAKTFYRVPAYLLFSTNRLASARAISKGILTGISGWRAKTLSA